MLTHIRIKLGTDTVLDLAERQSFTLDGVDYPRDWITRGGTVPGHTIETYDATPPPPPPEPPSENVERQALRALAAGNAAKVAAIDALLGPKP